MGPLHSPVQKAFVAELIEEAKAPGAAVREFGTLPTDPELAGGTFGLRSMLSLDPVTIGKDV